MKDVMGATRPIFVLGCPRSGTTLLQLMLHAHPRIGMPPETRFLLPIYQSRNEFGDLREESNRRTLAKAIVEPRKTRFYELELDGDQVIDDIVAAPPTLGSAFGAVFRAYARRFGKVRWGDKRPGYYQHIPVLLRLFPNAQIVHLIRDGRDCVASLKQMPWFHADAFTAVSTWAESIDYGRRTARRLSADTYFELHYEHLVADPQGQLTALCAFLGEEFDPAMAEPYKIAEDIVPSRKKWHSGTRDQVSGNRSGKWRDRLEPWEASLCETVAGRRLVTNGYELAGLPRSPADHVTKYARVAALRRGATTKRRLLDLRQRAAEPGPVECRL
jgi:hypothetical protein